MASPFKKLPHRNWDSLRDHWLGFLPIIDFDEGYPSPALWELPDYDNTLGAVKIEGVISYLPGVREAIFREAIILARKLICCWSIARIAAEAGKQTWTSVAAYDASFYGAKSLCYLLGFANLGRDSKLYLDAFHESILRTNKIRITYLDLHVYNLASRMEHSTLWSLTERLLNTTNFDGTLAQLRSNLQRIKWDNFSVFRNRVMYVGSFWPFSDEITTCDLPRPFFHFDVLQALDTSLDIQAPFAEQYFIAAKHFREMLYHMLHDIARLAPALAREAEILKPD